MLERRTYTHGIAALVSTELERAGFLVAFTERTGGVSVPPFATLNLGFNRDYPDDVRTNRARVCEALGIPTFARGWQVHGAGVTMVGPELARAGFDSPDTAIQETDALVTDHRGVGVSILTADCVPVAVVDVDRGRLGVIHVGWRGLAARVLDATLERFEPGRAVAVIGPAIAAHHYEVGADVVEAVTHAAGDSTRIEQGDRTLLDLPGTVEAVLEAGGVRVIERAGACTACEPDRFFSHRGEGETGRQAVIGMRP
jgi:YfiH family protein